jgi:hypothetical protein
MKNSFVGVNTLGTVRRRLRPKILNMIGSLQQKMVGEPYTSCQETPPPLEAEEERPPT